MPRYCANDAEQYTDLMDRFMMTKLNFINILLQSWD